MHNRYLCWDEDLIENSEGIEVVMHKPQKKNTALVCTNEWEGNYNGYAGIIKTKDKYMLYYRAATLYFPLVKGFGYKTEGVICVAESYDGITFTKPDLQIYDFNGTKHNNIVYMQQETIDNFSIFYDTNPNCPENERFKGISPDSKEQLKCYCSGDGYHFEYKYDINVKGSFDSYNVLAWDEENEEYVLYYRAFHTKDGEDRFSWINHEIHATEDIRDIRCATSKDFINWTEHGRIQFAKDKEDCPLYINQIVKYYRSDNMRIGFPVRYFYRPDDVKNFEYLPLGDRRKMVTQKFGREGTSFTDCVIMTSTDGINFNRRDEAFMTPGPENNSNWWYGDCYSVYNMVETKAEEYGAQNELSLYFPENGHSTNRNFNRWALRIDGFFSWYGKYKGGEVLTKPIKVAAENLKVNFATSAGGAVVIKVCDISGNELCGYESYTLFGDSIDRPVDFEKPLKDLIGKEVRLKIYLKDAHLYSFCFEQSAFLSRFRY